MSLSAIDKKYIWHPYTQSETDRQPVPVVSGEGAWLMDENGKKYLDTISSWWVNIHGHAHPYIAKKIAAQAKRLEQVIFAGFTHEPAICLAERILKVLPGNYSKVFYSDDGSTAVEVALKMALQYWHNSGKPRTKIIAFNGAYHGDTFGAMSVSGRGVFTKAFAPMLFEVIYVDPPVPGNEEASIQQLKKAVGSGSRQAAGKNNKRQTARDKQPPACFIFEPLVMGAGGMMMYDAQPLDEMIALCKRHHVLTVADEVMTGFGRTGRLFATAYLKNQPDIICLSKGITGGFLPLGLTACTEDVFNAFKSDDRSKTFFHGHSYTANPLACAAALASLDLSEKKEFKENIRRINRQHLIFRNDLEQYASVKNARVTGTILAFELHPSNTQLHPSNYLHPWRNRIYDFFIGKGILLRPLGNTVYLMPPYCITDEELNKVYTAIEEFLFTVR